MLQEVRNSHQPLVITQNSKAAAVLISPADFDLLTEQVRFVNAVKRGLTDVQIRRYIAADNPTAARKWVERLRKIARNTLHAPHAGRKVPEFSREDVRERIEENYRIVYLVFVDRIVILTIFEAHALFPLQGINDLV